jgi:hypothetical protein
VQGQFRAQVKGGTIIVVNHTGDTQKGRFVFRHGHLTNPEHPRCPSPRSTEDALDFIETNGGDLTDLGLAD